MSERALISNFGPRHIDVVNAGLRSADQIIILVAFLHSSGLSLIAKNLKAAISRGAKVEIVVGLDFYLTEPPALSALLRLLEHRPNAAFFLCQKGSVTYHPKLYFWRRGGRASVVVGSANLTGGGLANNLEASLHVDVPVNSILEKQLLAYVTAIHKHPRIVEATWVRVSQYQREFEIFAKKRKAAEREAKREVSSLIGLDINKLQIYLAEYRQSVNEKEDLKKRHENYLRAKKLLDQLRSETINSKSQFLDVYGNLVGGRGKSHLWHSGSVHRSINMIASKYKRFIAMVETVRAHLNRPVEDVFDAAMVHARAIKGLGPNVVTEILNTYAPRRFAVANANPVSALANLGLAKFSLQKNSFSGAKYRHFNDVILELARSYGFDDLSQVDHFLNFVYWNYAKPRRK